MVKTLHVLVIEDNLGDFHLLEESFGERGIPAQLYLVENAVQAFSFLSRQGLYAGMPRPDLILLDLNLPVIHGHKVLDVIRTTDGWSDIPIAVLSSSTLKKDQDEVARYGIEAYLVKPAHYDGYLELARGLGAICERLANRDRRRSASIVRPTAALAPREASGGHASTASAV